jgi:hypothetical protein
MGQTQKLGNTQNLDKCRIVKKNSLSTLNTQHDSRNIESLVHLSRGAIPKNIEDIRLVQPVSEERASGMSQN